MSGAGENQRERHVGEEARQGNGIKDGIDELINQERVVIFSKSTCPYCDDAKKVFDKLGQSYSTVELSDHPKGGEVQTALKEMTGAGTVPRVFVDGKCIGGGSDTVQLYRNGQLEEILRKGSVETIDTNESDRGSGEKFC
ncbi:unnamed protein product [Orchesella dallaii]|uniref:Glutaredoxin domain-containing protein n=1 Tax=Orchesella dallaii TaxID=48710 RepID=A0ABP1QU28_9HEXA